MPKVYLTEAARKEAAVEKRNKIMADHLRSYRARERISQDVLARRIGVSRGVISRLENGKLGLVESETVFAAARVTKLPAEDWLALGGYSS